MSSRPTNNNPSLDDEAQHPVNTNDEGDGTESKSQGAHGVAPAYVAASGSATATNATSALYGPTGSDLSTIVVQGSRSSTSTSPATPSPVVSTDAATPSTVPRGTSSGSNTGSTSASQTSSGGHRLLGVGRGEDDHGADSAESRGGSSHRETGHPGGSGASHSSRPGSDDGEAAGGAGGPHGRQPAVLGQHRHHHSEFQHPSAGDVVSGVFGGRPPLWHGPLSISPPRPGNDVQGEGDTRDTADTPPPTSPSHGPVPPPAVDSPPPRALLRTDDDHTRHASARPPIAGVTASTSSPFQQSPPEPVPLRYVLDDDDCDGNRTFHFPPLSRQQPLVALAASLVAEVDSHTTTTTTTAPATSHHHHHRHSAAPPHPVDTSILFPHHQQQTAPSHPTLTSKGEGVGKGQVAQHTTSSIIKEVVNNTSSHTALMSDTSKRSVGGPPPRAQGGDITSAGHSRYTASQTRYTQGGLGGGDAGGDVQTVAAGPEISTSIISSEVSSSNDRRRLNPQQHEPQAPRASATLAVPPNPNADLFSHTHNLHADPTRAPSAASSSKSSTTLPPPPREPREELHGPAAFPGGARTGVPVAFVHPHMVRIIHGELHNLPLPLPAEQVPYPVRPPPQPAFSSPHHWPLSPTALGVLEERQAQQQRQRAAAMAHPRPSGVGYTRPLHGTCWAGSDQQWQEPLVDPLYYEAEPTILSDADGSAHAAMPVVAAMALRVVLASTTPHTTAYIRIHGDVTAIGDGMPHSRSGGTPAGEGEGDDEERDRGPDEAPPPPPPPYTAPLHPKPTPSNPEPTTQTAPSSTRQQPPPPSHPTTDHNVSSDHTDAAHAAVSQAAAADELRAEQLCFLRTIESFRHYGHWAVALLRYRQEQFSCLPAHQRALLPFHVPPPTHRNDEGNSHRHWNDDTQQDAIPQQRSPAAANEPPPSQPPPTADIFSRYALGIAQNDALNIAICRAGLQLFRHYWPQTPLPECLLRHEYISPHRIQALEARGIIITTDMFRSLAQLQTTDGACRPTDFLVHARHETRHGPPLTAPLDAVVTATRAGPARGREEENAAGQNNSSLSQASVSRPLLLAPSLLMETDSSIVHPLGTGSSSSPDRRTTPSSSVDRPLNASPIARGSGGGSCEASLTQSHHRLPGTVGSGGGSSIHHSSNSGSGSGSGSGSTTSVVGVPRIQQPQGAGESGSNVSNTASPSQGPDTKVGDSLPGEGATIAVNVQQDPLRGGMAVTNQHADVVAAGPVLVSPDQNDQPPVPSPTIYNHRGSDAEGSPLMAVTATTTTAAAIPPQPSRGSFSHSGRAENYSHDSDILNQPQPAVLPRRRSAAAAGTALEGVVLPPLPPPTSTHTGLVNDAQLGVGEFGRTAAHQQPAAVVHRTMTVEEMIIAGYHDDESDEDYDDDHSGALPSTAEHPCSDPTQTTQGPSPNEEEESLNAVEVTTEPSTNDRSSGTGTRQNTSSSSRSGTEKTFQSAADTIRGGGPAAALGGMPAETSGTAFSPSTARRDFRSAPIRYTPAEIKPTPQDMEKVQKTLHQFVRDWSVLGEPERTAVYNPLITTLCHLFHHRPPLRGTSAGAAAGSADPRYDSLHNPNGLPWPFSRGRVLVPGAGLSRLSSELSAQGFDVISNEFSYHMIIAGSFALNRLPTLPGHTIMPFVDHSCNWASRRHQMTQTTVPDLYMRALAHHLRDGCGLRVGSMAMFAGDFCEVFADPCHADAFDAVVSCFFLDTANNILSYLERVYAILRPGGYLLNLGPLLYHFAPSMHDAYVSMKQQQGGGGGSSGSGDNRPETELTIELSLEEVLLAAQNMGFELFHVDSLWEHPITMIPSSYAASPFSMKQMSYYSAMFVLRKPLPHDDRSRQENSNRSRSGA